LKLITATLTPPPLNSKADHDIHITISISY